ncbi:hypothetical protein TrLO_g13327 [Triparma laevis f. longispina]|uniref:Arrestin-like N-terminal domain-containing protein n=1 Tax=Triparma laevis f. longispina TaxID=1714387 RepID=A0A9W7FV41_9STRA|nr:hypothetical protein TrLO_g13327 [Triparma laevis f. longispina]
MTSALSKCKKYEIQLARESGVYWLGEVITGNLILNTSSEISCRGVRLQCSGKSYIHWHTGSGDDRNDYYGSKTYFSLRQTAWGNFYSTMLKDGCGENCVYGETAGDGDLNIPMNTMSSPLGSFKIVVRVMDYDWGKKDDLLGEILLEPLSMLLQAPGSAVSFPLTRKGKKEKGEVTLSAYIEDNTMSVQNAVQEQGGAPATTSGMQTLKLKCHQATGLRKADWFGKNDVYVQAYIVGNDVQPGQALPEPIKNMKLPAGNIIVPFQFQIPWDSDNPSSLESSMGDSCYIRYSLYSNIDVSWKLDPSVRKMITILNPTLPPPDLLCPAIRPIQPDTTMYACCCCCARGKTNMNAMVDRQSASAGDNLFVMCEVKNATEQSLPFTIKLVRHEHGETRVTRMEKWHSKEYELYSADIAPGCVHKLSEGQPFPLKLPSCPPTFSPKKVDGYKGYHPVTWVYDLRFNVQFPGAFGSSMTWHVPITISPAPAPMLQNLGLLGQVPQPTNPVTINLSDPAPFNAPSNMQLPPTSYYTMIPPTNYGFESQPPEKDQTQFMDPQEDMNNFGGPMAPYAPKYPEYTVGAQQAPFYSLPVMPVMEMEGLKSSTAQVHPMNNTTMQMEMGQGMQRG